MMKKLLCLLAVVALTAPLFAGDLTITASDAGSGQLQIGYTVTSGTDVPVGISFVVSCDGDAEVTGVVSYDSDNFNCLPDEASDDPCSYVLGAGNPRALTDEAGSQSDPCTSVSICMGALYADPCAAPDTVSNLITLQLAGTGSCNVTISADTLRAEVQGADEFNVTYPGPTTVSFAPAECLKDTDPGYTRWKDRWGMPDCWCYQRQCKGDADGIMDGIVPITTDDLAIFREAFNKPYMLLNSALICADLDHLIDGIVPVNTDDLGIFRVNFNKPYMLVPVCPTTHINEWKN